MPTVEHRSALTARRHELASFLDGAEPNEVLKRVARVFIRFPSTRLSEEYGKATMAAYASDLSCFPLWVIDEACLSIIAGHENTSKAFAPSSVEIRKACERVIARVHRELADLSKVLDAKIDRQPCAEERARVLAGFRQLTKDLAMPEPQGEARG